MGRRVKKAVYAYGSGGWQLQKEILFVYDGWNLIQEKEVSGTGDPLFDKFYVWGLDLSQSLQGAGGIGGLVCRVSGGEVRHYFYDANGNVGQLVDPEDGAITTRYEYDPFGNAVVADGIDSEGSGFRFSTKYRDGETKLYYFGFRYYLPEIGILLRRDPIGESGGFNLYGFSSNNPNTIVDCSNLYQYIEYFPNTSLRPHTGVLNFLMRRGFATSSVTPLMYGIKNGGRTVYATF